MRHLFLAIHHPKPRHAAELTTAMGQFGAELARMPGMLDASAWRDGDRVVALSIWTSRQAFQDARSAMAAAIADVPFATWEASPRELFALDEVGRVEPQAGDASGSGA